MLNSSSCDRLLGAIVVSGFFLGVATTHSGAAEEVGPAAPAFRKPSSDEVIDRAFAASKVDQWLADFASGNGAFPECGGYIEFVLPESPFSKFGIPAGSVVERRRTQLHLSYPFVIELDPATLGGAADKFIWVNFENERGEVAVPSGWLGFSSRGFRNMPNWYLRHGQRNPKWDRHVILALERQGRDPAVAESCWATAIDQGYRPDKLSSWSGMLLALTNRELARAESFGEHVVPFEASSKPADFPFELYDIYKIALLTGDPSWFLRVGESLLTDPVYSAQMPNFLHQVDLAKDVPAETLAPSKLAKEMERESFLMKADTSPVDWSGNHTPGVELHERAAMAQYKGENEFPEAQFSVKLNQYSTYFFSPMKSSQDMDVEIKFRAEARPASNEQIWGNARSFTFGLVNRDQGEVEDIGPPTDSRILLTNLDFGPNDLGEKPAWDIHRNGIIPHYYNPVWHALDHNPTSLLIPTSVPYQYDPEKVHTLRIVRVGRQAEALLDGRRLSLAHVPESLQNPGLYLNVVGCKVTVTSLKADTLK